MQQHAQEASVAVCTTRGVHRSKCRSHKLKQDPQGHTDPNTRMTFGNNNIDLLLHLEWSAKQGHRPHYFSESTPRKWEARCEEQASVLGNQILALTLSLMLARVRLRGVLLGASWCSVPWLAGCNHLSWRKSDHQTILLLRPQSRNVQ